MAKRTADAPSNVGLIVTLIIFILIAIILGVLFYFETSDNTKLIQEKKEAESTLSGVQKQLSEARARLQYNNLALGTISAGDRSEFDAQKANHTAAIQDEQTRLKNSLSNVGVGEEFTFDPLAGQTTPTLPELLNLVRANRDSNQRALRQAEEDKEKLRGQMTELRDDFAASQKKFAQEVAQLQSDLEAIKKQDDERFAAWEKQRIEQGEEIQNVVRERNTTVSQFNSKLETTQKDLELAQSRIRNFEARQNPPDAKLNRPRGEVSQRSGSEVYLNIGSADNLREGTTFSVFPSDRTSLEAAELRNDVRVGLDGRVYTPDGRETDIPTDLRGAVQVIRVLGPKSSLARVTFERNPVREPIRAGDSLFNPAWVPGQQVRVAFSGIIDLDGDGDDDNEQFIRLLERQGVAVDAYLDLLSQEVKGKLTLDTSYLIEAPFPEVGLDDPNAAFKENVARKMGELREQAQVLGVQRMSARNFMSYIGVEAAISPRQPANYGSPQYRRPAGGGAADPRR